MMQPQPYVQRTIDALAYLERTAHTEETIELRRGLREVAQFLAAPPSGEAVQAEVAR